MDPYVLIAELIWTGFGLSLIVLIAGIAVGQGPHRTAAIALLLVAEFGTLTLSFIGGFSIGRFTAVIPVLVTGYVVGIGRNRLVVGACLIGSAVIYGLFSWLLTPLVLDGGVLAILFGFWAIPLYGVLAIIGFGTALANRKRPGDTAYVATDSVWDA